MAFKRTQIYLEPEEHRRLVREAAERGLSLTEYLRRIIGARTGEAGISYGARSWEPLFALTDAGSRDSVHEMDEEAGEAFDEELRRGLRRDRAEGPGTERRGGRS